MSPVDEYLAAVAPPQRNELLRIQKLITTLVPEARQKISYGMPAFTYKGKYLIAYGAFKNHLSLFPGAEPVGILKETLKGNITGKGTIQFTPDQPLSDEVIQEIVHLSMARVDSK